MTGRGLCDQLEMLMRLSNRSCVYYSSTVFFIQFKDRGQFEREDKGLFQWPQQLSSYRLTRTSNFLFFTAEARIRSGIDGP
jgi:hypothetical protein